jgi:hypothetical protein
MSTTEPRALERPRFFTGQLLTEAELNGEQAYNLARHRLHNRNLHGAGVVCGLQVLCHECAGWVTISAGHALDCHGNDLVVCNDRPFPLIEEIQRCRAAAHRQPLDCEPLAPRPDPGCADAEEHWCIALVYEEHEARAMAALRHAPATCECGAHPTCTCGGVKHGGCGWGAGGAMHFASGAYAGNGNGHGHAGASGRPCTCGHAGAGACTCGGVSRAASVPGCEPTRIKEDPRVVVFPAPGAEEPSRPLQQALAHCSDTLRRLLALAPRPGLDDPALACRACCAFGKAVREELARSPGTRCELFERLAAAHCPQPDQAGDPAAYLAALRAVARELQAILVQHVLDCVCLALLPPCPPCHDARVVLATVTVRGTRIGSICHGPPRRQVPGAPALEYLAGGVAPAFAQGLALALTTGRYGELLELICCADRRLGGTIGDYSPTAMKATMPPYGATAMASPVGAHDALLASAADLAGARAASDVAAERYIDARRLLGDSPKSALETLRRRDAGVRSVDAGDWPPELRARAAAATPQAVPADAELVLYADDTEVIGIRPLTREEALEERVAWLTERIENLESR